MIKRLNLLIFRSSDIPFDPLDIFVSGVKSISLVQRSIKIRIDDSFKLPSPRFRVYRFWSAIRRRNCGGRVQWTTIESVLTALSEREQIARPACCVCLVIYRRAGQTRRRTSTVMQEREKKRKLEPIGWAKGPSQEQCRSKFRVASVPCLSSCLSLCPLWLYLCSPYNTHTHTHTQTQTHIYTFLVSLRENGQVRREGEPGDDYYSTSSFTKFPRLNSGSQPTGTSVSFSGSFIIEAYLASSSPATAALPRFHSFLAFWRSRALQLRFQLSDIRVIRSFA